MRGSFRIEPLEPLESRRMFAVGQLDPTFGVEGGVTLQPAIAASAAMSRLPDGRLLVATGGDRDNGLANPVVTLSMLLPNGSLDPSFGGRDGAPAGVVRVDTGGSDFYVAEMLIADDGKILLAGRATNPQESLGLFDVAVARLNPDGSLDAGFGGAARGLPLSAPGVATINLNDMAEEGRDVAVGPGGRIAITAAGDSARAGYVLMLNADGSADATFADAGRLRLGNPGDDDDGDDAGTERWYTPNAVAFDADGTLIVGAELRFAGGAGEAEPQGAVWRLDATGGTVWDALAAIPVRDMALTPRGLLTAGDDDGDIAAQLLSLDDGSPVAGFGAGGSGVAKSPIAADLDRTQLSVVSQDDARLAVLPDGRFYVLADLYTQAIESNDFQSYYVARFNADGAPDPAFKTDSRPAVVVSGQLPYVWEESDLAISGGDVIVQTVANTATEGVGPYQALRARVVRIDSGEAAFGSATLNRRGTLQVHGDGGDDTIAVRWRTRDNRIVVDVNGLTVRSFPPTQVKRIQVWGYDGNDRVTIGPAGVLRLLYLDAGGGDDSVTGGDGNEYIVGGAGNDVLIGGPGNDVLEGNAGNDYLLGSAGRDVLFGNGGRDTLNGAGGHDQLFGGPGTADRVLGGAGEDVAARDELDTYDAVEVLLS